MGQYTTWVGEFVAQGLKPQCPSPACLQHARTEWVFGPGVGKPQAVVLRAFSTLWNPVFLIVDSSRGVIPGREWTHPNGRGSRLQVWNSCLILLRRRACHPDRFGAAGLLHGVDQPPGRCRAHASSKRTRRHRALVGPDQRHEQRHTQNRSRISSTQRIRNRSGPA